MAIHSTNKYHLNAVQAARNFLRNYDKPEKSIDNQVESLRLSKIKANCERLEPIVKTIILHGRQNIPLRGHRDDGKISFDELDDNQDDDQDSDRDDDESPINEGNFREILKYRAETDLKLKEHLKNSSEKATSISKTTQNELIECCKDEILNQILSEAQSAVTFSIMFDETTDLAKKSQLTLIIRYVYKRKIYEQFVEFIDVRKEMNLRDDPEENLDDMEVNEEQVKLTGIKIGEVVVKKIKDLNLDIKNCISITTDGCPAMISELRGAVCTIQKEAINAAYSPCYNHALNLAIYQSSKVSSIRNAVSKMQETTYF